MITESKLCYHSLFTIKVNAVKKVRKAQQRYKRQYYRNAKMKYAVGQWVLVRLPADETGKNQKLSRPWQGPHRVVAIRDLDIIVSKIYFPRDKQITIHQSRVKHCPTYFPAGFYWYGGKQRGQDKKPKWVELLLADGKTNQANDTGICEEADDDSERGAQLEAETDIHLEEVETPQPRQDANEYPSTVRNPPEMLSTGYSLRKHPRPSRKLIDSQVVEARD